MRQTTGIILLEFLTGFVLLVGMVFGLVAWRLVSGPVDLDFAKTEIEAALTRVRDGRRVEVGSVSMTWDREENRFEIVAGQLDFLGANEESVGAAERALISFSAPSLLTGKPQLSELVLERGALMIERRDNGEIHVADQTIPPVDPFLLENDANPFRFVELTLLNIVDRASHTSAIEALERVSLREFSVELVDVPLDISWSFSDVSLDARKSGSVINIQADGDAFGEGAPERVEFNGELDIARLELELDVSLLGQSLPDFPVMDLLPEEVSGDIPSDLSIHLGLREHGFDLVSISAQTSGGNLTLGDAKISLGVNDLTFLFNPDTNALTLDLRAFDVGFMRASGIVTLSDASAWFEFPFREEHPVVADLSELELDFRPVFEGAWKFQATDMKGRFDLQNGKLLVDALSTAFNAASAQASGEVYLAKEQDPKDLPFGVRLNARSEGQVSPKDVLLFWPFLSDNTARSWVARNVRSGKLTDAVFQMDLTPDSFRKGGLSNETLKLDFAFDDAVVSFLPDLPNVVRGKGQAQLLGNSFSLDVENASFSNWLVEAGALSISQFHPVAGELRLQARGNGSVQDILRTLSQSELQLEAKHGLPVSKLGGHGEGVFTYRLPFQVAESGGELSFEGRVNDANYTDLLPDMSLSHTYASVSVDLSKIAINGYGQLNDTSIAFDWSNSFDEQAVDPTRLMAKGNITPDLLNRFGIAARAYLSGDIPARLDARGSSFADLNHVEVDFDLTDNRIDLSEFDWVKLSGKPAKAHLSSRLSNGVRSSDLAVKADAFDFSGTVITKGDGSIETIRLGRVFLEDQLDVHGSLERTSGGGLDVRLEGPYLNAAPMLDGLFAGGSGGIPLFGNVDIHSHIDELVLRTGLSFEDVDLSLAFAGPDLRSLLLEGADRNGAKLNVSLGAVEGSHERLLSAQVGDAGSLFRALFGGDFIKGGVLKAEGVLRQSDVHSDLNITIDNARLKSAPLLTQVLSLASLRGLADVMNGEGILFSKVELPLQMDKRGYYLEGVKASGPAMGLTANGHILDNGNTLSLDGVLVPSFGVNSALGGIPIFGDLFVSRQGEGVFAITYDVRGSMSQAKVSVNPLSGLLPGVLRRIFENPSEPIVPAESESPADGTPAEN